MAKMKTKSSGDVAREVRITAEEVRAMIHERFPHIPDDAEMSVAIDSSSEAFEEVTFSWSSHTDDSQEIDLVPSAPKCRRQCQQPRDEVLHRLSSIPSKLAQIAEREANE